MQSQFTSDSADQHDAARRPNRPGLTDEDIQEFIEAWKEDFDETLSWAEARQRASEIMGLYLLLARPDMDSGFRQPA